MFGSPSSVWIGGRADLNREWTWSDNTTTFYYSNWNSGEPNNANNNEYCLSIQRQNGHWNDDNCGDSKPYVCSVLKSNAYPGSTPPNPKNCPVGYQPIGPSCFKAVSDMKTYADAKTACAQDKGSFGYAGLATIIDVHENSYLIAMMNEVSQPTKSSWIGLYYDNSLTPE